MKIENYKGFIIELSQKNLFTAFNGVSYYEASTLKALKEKIC